MKYLLSFKIVYISLFSLFFLASCVKEGPMGHAGADGKDGADGIDGKDSNASCLACHNSGNMKIIQGQFAMSAHSAGAIAVDYAGSRKSCSPCHSHEQFVQYAELGEVTGDITNPTAWKCNTCHGLHETFEAVDYALRLNSPVKSVADNSVTLDMKGNSNLCAGCHQAREPEPLAAKPGDDTFSVSAYFGPHHGPQANIVSGVGLAEFSGSASYPEAHKSYHLNDRASCTGCHMGEFGNGGGGHSWIPGLNACNTCHETADYNYKGRQTDVAVKLDQLRDKLVEFGVLGGNEENGYSPVPGTHSMVLARACFNWMGISEDRSLGVHNPRYINAVLVNTLEVLNEYQP